MEKARQRLTTMSVSYDYGIEEICLYIFSANSLVFFTETSSRIAKAAGIEMLVKPTEQNLIAVLQLPFSKSIQTQLSLLVILISTLAGMPGLDL